MTQPPDGFGESIYVGVKGHVAALSKADGRILWKTKLKSGALTAGDRFVTLLVEDDRIYAHTYGHLHCLEASTGRSLWTNKLEGFSYDIASLATTGISAPALAAFIRHQKSKSDSSSSSSSGHGGD